MAFRVQYAVMLKNCLGGQRGRRRAWLAALVKSPYLLTLGIFALQGCNCQRAAAPTVEIRNLASELAEENSSRDHLADAGGGYVEVVELPPVSQPQAPVSVNVAVAEPATVAELPPALRSGEPQPVPTAQRVAPSAPRESAAEPAPAAQSQAASVSLELDATELQPGGKLAGKTCGSWGANVARLLWVDGMGRVIAELGLKPPEKEAGAISFSLTQPEGGLGQRQQLVLVCASKAAFAKSEKEGTPVVFDIAAQAAFRVLPPHPTLSPQGRGKGEGARSWNDYVVLLGDGCENADPAFWRGLGRTGIQGGVVVSLEPATDLARRGSLFLSNALPHEGNPLHFGGNWAERLKAYAASRAGCKLCERRPALFDENVLAAVRADIERSVALKNGVPPLGWSLGDRLSLTQDAHPFDYDFSPSTLEVFRLWLNEAVYGSLSALNRQWGTEYKSWSEIKPPTTDEAKAANNPVFAKCLKALLSPPPPPAAAPVVSPATGEAPTAQPKAGETPTPPAPEMPEANWEEREGQRGFSLAPEQLSAPGHENFSAWSDWRTFCDFAFGRLLRKYREIIRQASHTQAAVGFLGAEAPSAWGGWDYSALSKSVDWIEEHDSIAAREFFRSFAPSAPCLTSFSTGQDADVRRLWDRWLRGGSGCILLQHQHWLTPPEYLPATAAKAFFAELHCLSGGLTLLRGQASPENDAVALYYSPRSVQMHWMLDSEAEGSWWLKRDGVYEATHGSALLQLNAWWTLLEDLGYAPRLVSPRQLLSGELWAKKIQAKTETAGVKVLVLPKVMSLSDEEAEALRNFAHAGGVVIADGACGTFDAHGKRRQPIFVTGTGSPGLDAGAIGTLDRDFGIVRRNLRVLERNGAFLGDDTARLWLRASTGESSTTVPVVGVHGQDARATLWPESSELRILEPGVAAGEARAHAVSRGGAAALLSAPARRGRFVYLNLAMQDYPQLRERRTAGDFNFHGMTAEEYVKNYGLPTGGEALRLLIGDILSEELPDNPLRVRWLDGTPPRDIKRVRFSLGKDAWLVSLLPTSTAGLAADLKVGDTPNQNKRKLDEVWVGLAKRANWYDLRSGQYLGLAEMVKTALDPNRPALLAALPYHAEKLKLKVRRTNPRGVFKVEAGLAVDSGEPGTHVFHLEITGPDGQLLPHYTRNVVAEKGRWATEIALAFNEPAGTYQLTVRDALTGNAATGSLLKDSAEYTSFSTPLKP